jgi:hypothetical protein
VLEVEAIVVRGHHCHSLLHANLEGIAYQLMHPTVEGGKTALKRTARLNAPLDLESVTDRPHSTLQGGVLRGLGIQGRLQHTRGHGGVGQILLQACSK